MNNTIAMLNKCHQAAAALVGRDLCTEDAEMAKNIGRNIKFDWKPNMGTLAKDATFKIVGVQLIWNGEKAYRVVCNDYDDQFGRPASPNEIFFLD